MSNIGSKSPEILRRQLLAGTGAAIVGFTPLGAGAVERTVEERMGDTVSAADFKKPFSGDITAAVNAAIASLPATGGSILIPPGSYSLTPVAGTSPNDFAIEDGHSALDLPEDACVLLREKKNITLIMDGVTITSGNAYAILGYRSINCHIVGSPSFIYSGTMGATQPTAMAFVRSLFCEFSGNSDGYYRNFLLYRCAHSAMNKPVALNSIDFAIYSAGFLDVPVDGSSDYIGDKWTNKIFNAVARNCQYGSFFCEYTENFSPKSYDANNSAVACNHFSLQTGPIRVYNGEIWESSDQNSGNTIDGYSLIGTGTSPKAGTGSALYNCKVNGCYRGARVAGSDSVVIDGLEATDYYATGLAVVTAANYDVDNLVITGFKDGGLNPLSTRAAAGNVKIAGLQLEVNSGPISNIFIDRCILNINRAGSTVIGITAYDTYVEGVTSLRLGKNIILGTQGTFGFVDFEDGNLTAAPTVEFGGAAVGLTYTRNIIDYKIQNGVLYFWGTIKLSAKGSSTGDALIKLNLPDAPSLSSNIVMPVNAWGIGWTSAPLNLVMVLQNSAAELVLYNDFESFTQINEGNFGNSTEIHFNGSYPI